jgi:hypothetical protein
LTRPRVDLGPGEAYRARTLLVPEPGDEIQLLALVRDGKTAQAVRTDSGPLDRFPPDLHSGGLERARDAAGHPPVDRLVAVTLRSGRGPSSLLHGLIGGSIRAEPSWIPILDRVRRLPVYLLRWLSRLVPNGAYGFGLPDAGLAVCLRVRSGRVERIAGARDLGVDPQDLDPVRLLKGVARVGRPRLALIGSERTIRGLLASRRPATALERAAMRGEVRMAGAPLRLRAALLLLRLAGA